MKKKVAVFANGWGSQFLQEAGGGIRRCAKENRIDLFSFVDYCTYSGRQEENLGEINIFRLPKLTDFDGVILATNSFNVEEERDILLERIRENHIPAVSLEYELEGMPYVGTDNYQGMYDLMVHLFEEHHVQRFLFVSGIPDHMECVIRLEAVREAAKKYGVILPEENILYCDWAATTAVRRTREWIENHDYLPDAIVCANDIMAIGVCNWLKGQGYSLPDDMIVTGYDCLYDGQVQQPALTTVSHSWDELGYRAMEILHAEMEGREHPMEVEIPTAFVCGESCGCQKAVETHLVKGIDWIGVDQHFRHMYKTLRKVETAEELNRNLSEFIIREGYLEGSDFMLCLHPDFFVYKDGQEPSYRSEGYFEPVDAICALYHKSARKRLKMTIKRAIFQNAETSEDPVCYIFVPVRSDSRNYGFAMLSTEFNIVQDNLLYIWTRHVNQYMEQISNNVKLATLTKMLEELSVTDGLTGVFNRSGSQKIIEPFLDKLQKDGRQAVVLIIDVDRMKVINDTCGHISGDIALRAVATSLQKALPSSFMVSRFGGDEFVAAGEYDARFPMEELIKQISEMLHKEIKTQGIPFPLDVSVGGVLLKPGEAFDMSACIHQADDNMYQMKAEHHKQTDAEGEN